MPSTRIAAEAARHPAAWRFLLPRHVAGQVVLANLEPIALRNLLRSYPSAVVLGRSLADLRGLERAVLWDGRRAPLRPGSIALAVFDDRDRMCGQALDFAMAADGERASIVSSSRPYRFALFPTPEQLRCVIGRGWPLTLDGSPRRWAGYWLASTPMWRYLGRSGLALRGIRGSVVEHVLDQVSGEAGGQAELRGLIAGRGLGQLTLRVRCSHGDLAVRVATSQESVRRLANHQRVLAQMPARLGSRQNQLAFPETLASGSAEGISWTAERWIRSPALRASRSYRPADKSWGALRAMADELARGARTGAAGAGWARAWLSGLDAVAPDLVDEVARALEPIESARMPTAWCHGDLWPGNVFFRRPPRPPLVIDWERARPDAPAGFDAVYAEVCRNVIARKSSFGAAAAALATAPSPELAGTEVGGRPYLAWHRHQQNALLLATVVHYATGENEGGPADSWTASWGEINVLPIVRVLRAAR
ncbi:MAG TPA: aminoglycoside phosphotransferase family protein [Streptosporangiaceae bacterium]